MKQQRTTNILLIIIIIILLAPALILAWVLNSNMRNSYTPPATKQTTNSTGDPQLDKELMLVSSVDGIAKAYFPGFKLSWTYDAENRIACIEAKRSDYSGYFVENAIDQPDGYLDDWNNTVQAAINTQKSVQRYFNQSDLETITAVVNVRDYNDSSKILLTVANGIAERDLIHEGIAQKQAEENTETAS